jgi:hypothetical protein
MLILFRILNKYGSIKPQQIEYTVANRPNQHMDQFPQRDHHNWKFVVAGRPPPQMERAQNRSLNRSASTTEPSPKSSTTNGNGTMVGPSQGTGRGGRTGTHQNWGRSRGGGRGGGSPTCRIGRLRCSLRWSVGDAAKAKGARRFFLVTDKVTSDLKKITKNSLKSLILEEYKNSILF